MKTLYYLLLEYALIVQLHLRGLWQKPPTTWNTGARGDVVLIPGFGEPWTFFASLGQRLHADGYAVHVIPELNYNTQPIAECLKLLRRYIENNVPRKPILLAHSKGGVVATLYSDSYPSSILKTITIATPFQGTLLGYLYFWNLKELVPSSPILAPLHNRTSSSRPILNLYAEVDNHVIPGINSTLPTTLQVKIPIVGHTRILHAEQTYQAIQKFLDIQP